MRAFKSATIAATVTFALFAASNVYGNDYAYQRPYVTSPAAVGHATPVPYTTVPSNRYGNFYRGYWPAHVYPSTQYGLPATQRATPALTPWGNRNVRYYRVGNTWYPATNPAIYVSPDTYPVNTVPELSTAPTYYTPDTFLPVNGNPSKQNAPGMPVQQVSPSNPQPEFESPFYGDVPANTFRGTLTSTTQPQTAPSNLQPVFKSPFYE